MEFSIDYEELDALKKGNFENFQVKFNLQDDRFLEEIRRLVGEFNYSNEDRFEFFEKLDEKSEISDDEIEKLKDEFDELDYDDFKEIKKGSFYPYDVPLNKIILRGVDDFIRELNKELLFKINNILGWQERIINEVTCIYENNRSGMLEIFDSERIYEINCGEMTTDYAITLAQCYLIDKVKKENEDV